MKDFTFVSGLWQLPNLLEANLDVPARSVPELIALVKASPGTLALSREGRVRPLAVTSAERSPAAPEIPAIAEFLPGFDVVSWTCLIGPAGVPAAAVSRMSALSKQALESPQVVRAYRDQGAEPWWTTPEEIAAHPAARQARVAPLIRASGARVD